MFLPETSVHRADMEGGMLEAAAQANNATLQDPQWQPNWNQPDVGLSMRSFTTYFMTRGDRIDSSVLSTVQRTDFELRRQWNVMSVSSVLVSLG